MVPHLQLLLLLAALLVASPAPAGAQCGCGSRRRTLSTPSPPPPPPPPPPPAIMLEEGGYLSSTSFADRYTKYTQQISVCHGGSGSTSIQNHAGAVVVIATFYMGTADAAAKASEFAELAQAVNTQFGGSGVQFLASIKGTARCASRPVAASLSRLLPPLEPVDTWRSRADISPPPANSCPTWGTANFGSSAPVIGVL